MPLDRLPVYELVNNGFNNQKNDYLKDFFISNINITFAS